MAENTGFSIITRELGPMENFVYLLHDHASGRAAIVDPAWEVEQLVDLAQEQDIRITDILLTHSHNDHINGIGKVLDAFDAEVHLTRAELDFWNPVLGKATAHHGGDRIAIGETDVDILHTPGHTPGSACYRIGNELIAGDTLFVFGCGRCDLAGGDPEQLFDTLRKIKSDLPADMVLRPGHNFAPAHPTSTLDAQAAGNPFMHFDNSEDFVRFRMEVHDNLDRGDYDAVSPEQAHCWLHDHD